MSSPPDPDQLRKAISLFRSFQYRAPRGAEIIELGGLQKPVVALLVGNAVSIGYKALGDGELYMHEFESQLPKIYVNAEGDQAYFVGGSYRFTSRGFLK